VINVKRESGKFARGKRIDLKEGIKGEL